MKTPVSETRLNAFVDSELSPSEAALVAEAVAADPTLAKRVVRLHKIKAALAAFGDDLPVPELPQPAPHRRTARGRLVASGAIAATALLLLVSVSVPVSAPEQGAADLPRLAQHDLWLSTTTEAGSLELPRGFEWMGPVMRASGLQLVHSHSHDDIMHFGFKGANSCRLSLFVATSATRDTALQVTLSDQVQHAQWQTGRLAFEMIARDMAPARFATVATGLQQGSREHQAESKLRIALLESARLPCLI